MSQKTTKNRPLPYVCPPYSPHPPISPLTQLSLGCLRRRLLAPWIEFQHLRMEVESRESFNCGWSVRLSGWVPTAAGLFLSPKAPRDYDSQIQFSGGSQFATLIDHTSFFPSFLLFGPPNHSKGVQTCTFPPSYHFFLV